MSRRGQVLYCELCGAPITGRAYRIVVEGIELVVCERCYRRYMEKAGRSPTEPLWYRAAAAPRRPPVEEPRPQQRSQPRPATTPTATATTPRGSQARRPVALRSRGTSLGAVERYEVVPNYAELIRRARERLGWTHRILAEKVRESERTIKRIEAGELVPTIDLARRLERVLGIKLLEPVVEEADEALASGGQRKRFYLTLGDIAEIRED